MRARVLIARLAEEIGFLRDGDGAVYLLDRYAKMDSLPPSRVLVSVLPSERRLRLEGVQINGVRQALGEWVWKTRTRRGWQRKNGVVFVARDMGTVEVGLGALVEPRVAGRFAGEILVGGG